MDKVSYLYKHRHFFLCRRDTSYPLPGICCHSSIPKWTGHERLALAQSDSECSLAISCNKPTGQRRMRLLWDFGADFLREGQWKNENETPLKKVWGGGGMSARGMAAGWEKRRKKGIIIWTPKRICSYYWKRPLLFVMLSLSLPSLTASFFHRERMLTFYPSDVFYKWMRILC